MIPKEIDFHELETAMARPSHRPSEQARIVLAAEPSPFVAPKLRYAVAPEGGPFAAEVVYPRCRYQLDH